tara:strand:+ start:1405 stop:2319 length:915 start_codon:yes stop_codon:yes gene_type:complete
MNNNKVLVLGANGMLGKMLSLYLDSNKELEITITSRKSTRFIERNFSGKYLRYDALLNNIDELFSKKDTYGCIVNCIGIIKPKIDENDVNSVKNTIQVNSYLPVDLQRISAEKEINYIQIGTDCVFSGDIGSYYEDSFMDAKDLYGKSKITGEIESKNKHIVRSSIIGPEEGKGFSLMNWFLKNEEKEVSGFQNHMWNGVTTLNFSKVVEGMIKNHNFSFKTQHLIPKNAISKAQLLEELKKHFRKDINIKHINSDTLIDRTLLTKKVENNDELWNMAGYDNTPSIEENIEELANSEIVHRIMN